MADAIDCREASAQLYDYLKRELTPELAETVRRHLEECSHCFDRATFEQNFLALLRARARREVCPGELRERILRILGAESAPD
jgi:anti-sigma factor (TIGR02949 family)